MLTLNPAFDDTNRARLIERIICQEPTAPRKVDPGIPPDLETIVLKALAKEPVHRYPDAAALADDLRNFLADRPIQARRSSTTERAWRWCRRNPILAGLTAAVFLLLAVVATVSSVGYVRTNRALVREEEQREAAVAQEKKANEEAQRARRLLYAADVRLASEMWQSEYGTARFIDKYLAIWDGSDGGEDLREFAWRYQWGLLHDVPGILREHSRVVVHGAFRADGKVVTLDEKGVLRSWEPVSARAVVRKDLHEPGEVGPVALAGDGSIAAVRTGTTVRLIDPATTTVRRELAVPKVRGNSLRLTPDGRKVLLRRRMDDAAWLWDTISGKREGPYTGPADRLERNFALSPDGTTLAIVTGALGKIVRVWDLRSNSERARFKSDASLHCVTFSRDGKHVAGGTRFGRVFVWDVAGSLPVRHFDVHIRIVGSLAFSDDGKWLASGSGKGMVGVTDLSNGKTVYYKGHTHSITFVALSSDGKKLVSGSQDGAARVWDLTRRPGPTVLHKGEGACHSLVCSPDGHWLAVAQGHQVHLWDARTWQFVKTLPVKDNLEQTRLAFSPDSKTLAVGNAAGAVQLWDVEMSKPGRVFTSDKGLPIARAYRAVLALAFSRDGNSLVTGHGALSQTKDDYNQIIRVWDIRTGGVLHTLPQRNSIDALVFSPDGTWLAGAGAEKHLRIWNVADWQLVADWVTPGPIVSVAFSPRGDLIATGQARGLISIWKPGSDQPIRVLREHLDRVTRLVFTPDGKTLISVSADRTVRLWHVDSGRALLSLRDFSEPIRGAVVTPDGNTMVTLSASGSIFLWRAPSPARVEAIQAARKRGREESDPSEGDEQ
jgi:WD40 repeat protein